MEPSAIDAWLLFVFKILVGTVYLVAVPVSLVLYPVLFPILGCIFSLSFMGCICFFMARSCKYF